MLILFLASIVFFGLACLAWAYFVEPRRFQVVRHTVHTSKRLQRPLKILHLTDIHFAKKQKPMDRFFDRLSREKYDYAFLTGDIFDCVSGIETCEENLKKINARYGLFAVLGNHDYYDYRETDVFLRNFQRQKYPDNHQRTDLLMEALVRARVKVLRNESVRMNAEGDFVGIHGLDDPTTLHANPHKIRPQIKNDQINLLLTHTVDALCWFSQGEVDMSFSGHSHGGQICFPFFGALVTHTMLGRHFVEGVQAYQGAQCSISRGLGTGRYFPLRFLCPPEAVVITLQSKQT